MTKRTFAAIAAVSVLTAGPAFANMGDKHQDKHQDKQHMDDRESMELDRSQVSEEERVDEVAGIRIVPSVIAKDVHLTPSAWYLRGEGRMANANAKVYTDREGAITGVTLNAWGLPNPGEVHPRYSDYVVWLVDTDTNEMKNIGVLESRNGGEAIFGFTPEEPLVGFDRIVVTPEPTFAIGWPTGHHQLQAELSQVAMQPMPMEETMPMDDDMPMMEEDDDM